MRTALEEGARLPGAQGQEWQGIVEMPDFEDSAGGELSAELESSADDGSPLKFNQSATAHLSPHDQWRFEQFGQGPRQALPFECIHHAIEAQVAARPQAIAAEHQGRRISYAEFDDQASRLARRLSDHGVAPGNRVALFVHRSIEMVVGIFAVLKAGASYVPQHVGVAKPPQLRHVAEVAQARVVLTLSHLREQLPLPPGTVCLAIDELMAEPLPAGGSPRFEPRRPLTGADGCFTLFTSGTTGMPNGV